MVIQVRWCWFDVETQETVKINIVSWLVYLLPMHKQKFRKHVILHFPFFFLFIVTAHHQLVAFHVLFFMHTNWILKIAIAQKINFWNFVTSSLFFSIFANVFTFFLPNILFHSRHALLYCQRCIIVLKMELGLFKFSHETGSHVGSKDNRSSCALNCNLSYSQKHQ